MTKKAETEREISDAVGKLDDIAEFAAFMKRHMDTVEEKRIGKLCAAIDKAYEAMYSVVFRV